jgi:hypothetical protein
MVHPHRGATSTNSSSSLLSFVNLLTCTESKTPLHIGQEIYTHLARSSFSDLGHITKPYAVYAQSTTSHFHLDQQALTHLLAHSLVLALNYLYLLHRLDFYLYITQWA